MVCDLQIRGTLKDRRPAKLAIYVVRSRSECLIRFSHQDATSKNRSDWCCCQSESVTKEERQVQNLAGLKRICRLPAGVLCCRSIENDAGVQLRGIAAELT